MNQNRRLSKRLYFPDDEKRLAWLPALLDAYAVADTGIAIALRDAEKKRKKVAACTRGCDVCCRQTDIPVYPHELAGLYWYASEKMQAAARDRIQPLLAQHAPGDPCPFLIDGACEVHPVRPLSCRQYHVFTTPCTPGEDPYYSRRGDVLDPLAAYTDRAFAAVMGFYELRQERDNTSAIRLIRSRIMNMQTYDWGKLAGNLKKT